MKVSHILGLTLTVSLLSFGGWVGCSDGDVKNNPDGLDAASFPKDSAKPDTATTPDTGDTDAEPTGDSGTDTGTTTDSGKDSGDSGTTIVDASDAG